MQPVAIDLLRVAIIVDLLSSTVAIPPVFRTIYRNWLRKMLSIAGASIEKSAPMADMAVTWFGCRAEAHDMSRKMLSDRAVRWILAYHDRCFDVLAEAVPMQWLQQCFPEGGGIAM